MSVYRTVSPVLFLIFNRPGVTFQVFEKIREAQPSRLYVAADGPRPDKNEAVLCKETRAVIEKVDWKCEVRTLFRDSNLGCRNAVSSAIDWFFHNEEEGIILEDDCLPSNDFFFFCDTLLERYRNDTRVRHISGCNLQGGKVWGDGSYYFSNLTHVWGWASWRRVWADYDKELKPYSSYNIREKLLNIFSEPLITDTWETIFNAVKAGKMDTWDYQLTFINFFNNSLSVIPNQNLISNMGFDASATHTKNHTPYANIPLAALTEIIHPLYILPEKEADLNTLNYDFHIDARRKKQNRPKYKLKRWLKNNMFR